jgi:TP901 family phage tail tape measure protein
VTTEQLHLAVTTDTRQLDQLQRKVATMTGTAAAAPSKFQRFSSAVQSVGTRAKYGAIATAALGIAAFKTAAEYERAMNIFQVQTGATEKEMAAAGKTARALGKDAALPAVSAKDAADAMIELAKGGFTARESMEAARGTLLLAQAAQVDEAEAATVVARTLKAYGLEAKDAQVAVDAMAGASLKSTASMQEIAKGMEFASTSAHILGVDVTDTASALAILNDAGISGAKAGTALNEMFKRMVKPTKEAKGQMKDLGLWTKQGGSAFFDARGEFVGMHKASGIMTRALKDLNPQQRQFALQTMFAGTASRAAHLVLGRGTKLWDEYRAATGKSGTASKLAGANAKGSAGAWESMKNAVQDTAIALGTALAPAITAVLGVLTPFLDFLGRHPRLAAAVVIGILAITVALWALSSVLGVVGAAIAVFGTAAVVAALPVIGVVVGVIAAIVALGVAMVILYKKSETFRNIVNAAWDAIKQGALAAFGAVKRAILAVAAFLQATFMPVLRALILTATQWGRWFVQIFAWVKGQIQQHMGTIRAVIDALRPAFRIAATVIKTYVGIWVAVVRGFIRHVALVVRLVLALLRGDWRAAWRIAKEIVRNAVDTVKTVLRLLWSAAKNILGNLKQLFVNVFRLISRIVVESGRRLVQGFLGALRGMIGSARQAANSVKNAVVGVFRSAANWLVAEGRSIIRGLISGIGALIGQVGSKVAQVKSKVTSAVSGAASWLFSAGQAVLQGFIRGLESQAAAVASKISSIGSSLKNKAKSALKILSPSRVFRDEVGVPVMLGLAEGIRRAAPVALRAVDEAAGALVPTVRAPAATLAPATAAPAAAPGPLVHVDTLVVREEADLARIAASLSAGMAVRA